MGVLGRLPRGPSALVVGAVLLLIFLLGRLRAFQHAGEANGVLQDAGLWPVGLGAGLVVLAAGRLQHGLALAAVALTTLAAGLTADLAVATSGALAAGAVTEAWVVARLVARDGAGRARLTDNADAVRLGVAALAAAGTGAVIAALAVASGLTGQSLSDAVPVAGAIAATHLVSNLLFVPFFLRTPADPPSAGRWELVVQTLFVVVLTPLLFLPDVPGTVFLVFPFLAWGAARCGFRVALLQAAVLGVLANQLTVAGLGPFVAGTGEAPSALVAILLLQGYVISGVAVVLALALAVATQHRHAAEVVAERQRAEGLVRSAVGTAIVATDLAGEVWLANPGAVELFGYDAATLATLSVSDLFPEGELAGQAQELNVPPDLVSVMEAMGGSSDAPGERREWVVLRADRKVRAHLLGFARLADEQGETVGYVMISEDITDRIQLQESLANALQAEREVSARMEELDGVKEALVSSVSHELRTPVTSILGFVEMLEDGDYGRLSDEQAEVLGRVSENGSRLLTLIDDLLGLARIQDGAMPLDRQPLDLRDVVGNAWPVLEGRLRDRDLQVSTELPDAPAITDGDRDHLERLVVNLVGNAIKFTPDGGRVTVRVRRVDDRLALEVSDTGIGIPREEQEQLFGRFFRSSLASEKAIEGTGLGLSIVKAIAEQHGGSVSVESEPGHGSTFRVDLPASGGAEEKVAEPAPVARVEPDKDAEPAPVSLVGPDKAAEWAPVSLVPRRKPAEPAKKLAEAAPLSLVPRRKPVEPAEEAAESAPVSLVPRTKPGRNADEPAPVSPEVLPAVEMHADSAEEPGGEMQADSAEEPESVPEAAAPSPGDGRNRSVEELLAAVRGAAAAPPPRPVPEDQGSDPLAAVEDSPTEPDAPEPLPEPGVESHADSAAEPDEKADAESDEDPEEPEEPAEEPRAAASPTAASRLAAARQSAGAQDPGDAARAILDAFGPRPGR